VYSFIGRNKCQILINIAIGNRPKRIYLTGFLNIILVLVRKKKEKFKQIKKDKMT
jgi:hypothetical protein